MKFPKLYEHSFNAMGSPCKLSFYAHTYPTSKQAISLAVTEITRLESKYSRYLPDSLLSKINQVAATGGTIEVDEETSSLLDYAAACFQDSDGLFDITSGLLRKVWSLDKTACPDSHHIEQLRSSVGWNKLVWASPSLQFPFSGLELDLGGIVKEYAADRAAEILLNHGIEQGVVNLGGDIHIIGPQPDGTPWLVGIRHPRNKNSVMGFINVSRGAIATSGDYERCFYIDGSRYSHIINPRTGWPVSHLASVTVISDLCVVAGSLSTIAMLKEDAGAQWLESQHIPHYWMDGFGNDGGTLLPTVLSGG